MALQVFNTGPNTVLFNLQTASLAQAISRANVRAVVNSTANNPTINVSKGMAPPPVVQFKTTAPEQPVAAPTDEGGAE